MGEYFKYFTLMLYKLIPFYSIIILLSTHFLYAKDYANTHSVFQYISIYSYFETVLIAPIIEELNIRYWLYGKNKYLRVGFLVSFVLCILITSYKLLSYNPITTGRFYIYIIITLVGVLVTLYLYLKQKNTTRVIQWVNLFNQKWITCILMIAYFVVYHLYGLDQLTWEYIGLHHLISTTVITLVARKYGILSSILVHMMINAVAQTAFISLLNEVGRVSIKYYYLSFAPSIMFILINLWLLHQLHKDKDFDVRK
jgi:hypothetical protein